MVFQNFFRMFSKRAFSTIFLFLVSFSLLVASPPKKKKGAKQFKSTGDNTQITQNGDNKAFHSRKRATLSNMHFRVNKGTMRSTQRQHANFQGHDDDGRN